MYHKLWKNDSGKVSLDCGFNLHEPLGWVVKTLFIHFGFNSNTCSYKDLIKWHIIELLWQLNSENEKFFLFEWLPCYLFLLSVFHCSNFGVLQFIHCTWYNWTSQDQQRSKYLWWNLMIGRYSFLCREVYQWRV